MDEGNSRKKGVMRVAGWYMVDVEFPDMANKLDEVIIDTVANCGAVLPHATCLEGITAVLDILLSNARVEFLRARERVNV